MKSVLSYFLNEDENSPYDKNRYNLGRSVSAQQRQHIYGSSAEELPGPDSGAPQDENTEIVDAVPKGKGKGKVQVDVQKARIPLPMPVAAQTPKNAGGKGGPGPPEAIQAGCWLIPQDPMVNTLSGGGRQSVITRSPFDAKSQAAAMVAPTGGYTGDYTDELWMTQWENSEPVVSTGAILNPYTGEIAETFESALPPPDRRGGDQARENKNKQLRLDWASGGQKQMHQRKDLEQPLPAADAGTISEYQAGLQGDMVKLEALHRGERDQYGNRNDVLLQLPQMTKNPYGQKGLQQMIRLRPTPATTNQLDNGGYMPVPEATGTSKVLKPKQRLHKEQFYGSSIDGQGTPQTRYGIAESSNLPEAEPSKMNVRQSSTNRHVRESEYVYAPDGRESGALFEGTEMSMKNENPINSRAQVAQTANYYGSTAYIASAESIHSSLGLGLSAPIRNVGSKSELGATILTGENDMEGPQTLVNPTNYAFESQLKASNPGTAEYSSNSRRGSGADKNRVHVMQSDIDGNFVGYGEYSQPRKTQDLDASRQQRNLTANAQGQKLSVSEHESVRKSEQNMSQHKVNIASELYGSSGIGTKEFNGPLKNDASTENNGNRRLEGSLYATSGGRQAEFFETRKNSNVSNYPGGRLENLHDGGGINTSEYTNCHKNEEVTFFNDMRMEGTGVVAGEARTGEVSRKKREHLYGDSIPRTLSTMDASTAHTSEYRRSAKTENINNENHGSIFSNTYTHDQHENYAFRVPHKQQSILNKSLSQFSGPSAAMTLIGESSQLGHDSKTHGNYAAQSDILAAHAAATQSHSLPIKKQLVNVSQSNQGSLFPAQSTLVGEINTKPEMPNYGNNLNANSTQFDAFTTIKTSKSAPIIKTDKTQDRYGVPNDNVSAASLRSKQNGSVLDNRGTVFIDRQPGFEKIGGDIEKHINAPRPDVAKQPNFVTPEPRMSRNDELLSQRAPPGSCERSGRDFKMYGASKHGKRSYIPEYQAKTGPSRSLVEPLESSSEEEYV